MILRFKVRLGLRYAAQDYHNSACTPKSLRRFVYEFRLTSILLFSSHPRYPTSLQSVCSTTKDSRSRIRFTIFTIPSEFAVPELPRYTIGSDCNTENSGWQGSGATWSSHVARSEIFQGKRSFLVFISFKNGAVATQSVEPGFITSTSQT